MKSNRPRLKGEPRRAKALLMQEEYNAGASIRSLFRRHGYSYGTVRNLLLEVDTPLREPGRHGLHMTKADRLATSAGSGGVAP